MLGEISHMRYIDSFDVLEEPKAEPSFLLSQLPDKLRGKTTAGRSVITGFMYRRKFIIVKE